MASTNRQYASSSANARRATAASAAPAPAAGAGDASGYHPAAGDGNAPVSATAAAASFRRQPVHHQPQQQQRPGGTTASSAATAAGAATARMLDLGSQTRMGQLFDEQDHRRCSEGNRKALLAENLDQLRGLVKVLEADDWRYAPVSSGGGSGAGAGAAASHAFAPDGEFSAAGGEGW